ncbi:MAG TPA: hypothetical protein PLO65_16000, partial [Caulobacter sp.]|nr:hypothetical protein [Caulobacter sp.]
MRKTSTAIAAALLVLVTPVMAQQADTPPGGWSAVFDDSALREASPESIDASIAWIDYLLRRTREGDILMENRDLDIAGGAEIVFPVNRDILIRAMQLEVSDGNISARDGARKLILIARASGRLRAGLQEQRQRLVVRRRELRTGGSLPPPPPPPPLQPWELGRPPATREVACVAEGVWGNTIRAGSSTWTIAANGSAAESGMGNARGQATLANDVLTITFRTGAVAGVYRIDV